MIKAIGSAEGIREMIFNKANEHIIEKDEIPTLTNYAFHFPEYKAIVSLILYENLRKVFKSKLLKSAYVCQIAFFDQWNEEAAKKILNILFPDDKAKIWEEFVNVQKEVNFAKIHNYYLFVSIPFGKRSVELDGETQIELVEKNLVKAYGENEING